MEKFIFKFTLWKTAKFHFSTLTILHNYSQNQYISRSQEFSKSRYYISSKYSTLPTLIYNINQASPVSCWRYLVYLVNKVIAKGVKLSH